jgi:hypothetical protein
MKLSVYAIKTLKLYLFTLLHYTNYIYNSNKQLKKNIQIIIQIIT